MAERESSLAVLVDFENMARPGAKGRGDFDIHLVNNRLAEKGRVLVKRAYADWSRYRDARHEHLGVVSADAGPHPAQAPLLPPGVPGSRPTRSTSFRPPKSEG